MFDIADFRDALTGELSSLQSRLQALTSDIETVTDALPFGNDMLADDVSDFIAQIDGQLTTIIDAVTTALDPDMLADDALATIAAALNGVDGLEAEVVDGDILVGLARTEMLMLGEHTIGAVGGVIDLGDANLDVDAAFAYDISLSVDGDTGAIALADNDVDEFSFTLTGDLVDVPELTASLGFVDVTLSEPDTAPGDPDTSELSFAVTADLVNLAGEFDIASQGAAGLTFDIETAPSILENILPTFSGRFEAGFAFMAGTDGPGSFEGPNIAFRDITVDAGSIAGILDDVFGELDGIVDSFPLGTLLDILNAEIPILNIKFADLLAGAAAATGRPIDLSFLDAINGIRELIDRIDDFSDEGEISLGDYTLADGGTPTNSLTGALSSLSGGSPMAGGKGAGTMDAAPTFSLGDAGGLSVPILEDPVTTIGGLLFNNLAIDPVTLIEYDLPPLTFTQEVGQSFYIGPFFVNVGGLIGAALNFDIGYNTAGFTGGAVSFEDGFYIRTTSIEEAGLQNVALDPTFTPLAVVSLGVGASAGVGVGIVEIGIGGGVLGSIGVSLDANDSGLTYLSDLASFPCIFEEVAGGVDVDIFARIKIGFGPFSFTLRPTLAKFPLARFDIEAPCNLPPNLEVDNSGLATTAELVNTLVLNIGDRSGLRQLEEGLDVDEAGNEPAVNEVFNIALAPADEDGTPADPNEIVVEAFTVFERYGDLEDGMRANIDVVTGNAGAGDDVITLDAGLTIVAQLSGGDGNDVLRGAQGNDTLDGGNGNDDLTGGAGSDTLRGGEGDDFLEGGADADILDGEGGSDTVDYSSSTAGVTFTRDGANRLGSGGHAEGDTLISIERITGSSFNDVLIAASASSSILDGNNGNDVLLGDTAADLLIGGLGRDVLIGGLQTVGGGIDRTTYALSTGAVYIRFDAVTQSYVGFGGHAEGDRLYGIEGFQLSLRDDRFDGSARKEEIEGFYGDDVIDGGGGEDIIFGGGGNDTIFANGSFARLSGDAPRQDVENENGDLVDTFEVGATAPAHRDLLDIGAGQTRSATVDLLPSGGFLFPDLGTVRISGLGTDFLERAPARDGSLGGPQQFSTFEDVSGGQGNDTISGDDANNVLDGRSGNDTLSGRGGDDILIGGTGADTLTGGQGRDTVDYSRSGAAIDVDLSLLNTPNSGGDAQGDRYTDALERIVGSRFRDDITGNGLANDIDPGLFQGSGVEDIDGAGGRDRLILNYDDPRLDDFDLRVRLNSSGNGTTRADGVLIQDLTSIEQLDIVTGDGDADIRTVLFEDDIIITGAGEDRIFSSGGSDIVLANAGDDRVELLAPDPDGDDAPVPPAPSLFSLFGTNGRFLLADGGSGTDTLSVDVADQAGALFLAGLLLDVPPGQTFVSDGDGGAFIRTQGNALIRNFEIFEKIYTGAGGDTLAQLGDVDNVFRTGRDNDIILPGLGSDEIDGGTNFVPGPLDNTQSAGSFTEDTDTLVLNYRGAETRVFVSYDISSDYTVDSGAAFLVESGLPITFPIAVNAESLRDNLDRFGEQFEIEILEETTFENIERLVVEGTQFDDVLFGLSNPRSDEDVEDVDTGDPSDGYYAFDRRFTTGERSPDIPVPTFDDVIGDYIDGGDGNDLIDGIDGDDTLIGGSGFDYILGGLGDDIIIAGVAGGSDRDSDNRQDFVDAGPGADLIVLGDETGLHYAEQSGILERLEIANFDTREGDRLQLVGQASDYTFVLDDGGDFLRIHRNDRDIDDEGSLVAFLRDGASNRGFLGDFSLTQHVTYVDLADDDGDDEEEDAVSVEDGLDSLLSLFRTGDISEAELLDAIGTFQSPDAEGAEGFAPLALPTPPANGLASSVQLFSGPASQPGIGGGQGGAAPLAVPFANGPTGFHAFQAPGPFTVEQTSTATVDGFIADIISSVAGQAAGNLVTRYEGSSRGFGSFEDAFGLADGIVLSTGDVEDIAGENLIDGNRTTGPTPFSQNITLEFEQIADFGSEEVFRALIPYVPGGLRSLTFSDTNGQGGGGNGFFTGFDFDAIALSTERIETGTLGTLDDLNDPLILSRIDAFDFSPNGIFYEPGAQTGGSSQRDLNGSINGFVNTPLASLGTFDGVGGNNAVTLGENGSIGFNLTQPIVSTAANPVYVYIAESGGTDEFVGSAVTVSTQEIGVEGDLSTDLGRPGAEDDRTSFTAEFDLDLGDESGDLFELFNLVIASEELIEFSGIDPEDLIEVRINGVNAAYLNNGAAATINNLAFSQDLVLPFGLGNASSDFGEDLILNLVGESDFNEITRADAFSKVLTVAAPLFSGRNTVEITVADTRDAFLDTALFLAPFTQDTRIGDAFGTVPFRGTSTNPDNAAPIAVGDVGIGFRTVRDKAFTTGSVLVNDIDPDPADTLTVIAVDTLGTVGTVTSNGDGTFNYDPGVLAGILGDDDIVYDSFRYTISDGNGGESTAEVEIAVLGSSVIDLSETLPGDPADGDTDDDGSPNDQYLGTNGDDTIIPDETGEEGRPNDDIDGGPGSDTVVYRNPRDEYTAERDPDDPSVIILTHNPPDGSEGDGRDRIENVELIEFPDFGPTSIDNLFNRPPSDIDIDNLTVDENAPGADVGRVTVTDPNEGDTITVSVDDPRFIVEDGILRLRDGVALDFETQGPAIPIKVTATDQGGLFRTEMFDVLIGDTPEPIKPGDDEFHVLSVNDWYDPRWGGGFNLRFEITLTDRLVTGDTVTDWILDLDYGAPNVRFSTGSTNSYNAPVSFDASTGQFSTVNEGYKLTLEEGDTIEFFVQVLDGSFDPAHLCLSFNDVDPDNDFESGDPDGNNPPTDLDLDNSTIASDDAGAVVGTLTVTDPDEGDTFSFTVDDERFIVDGFDLKLKDGVSVSPESDGSSIDVLVTVADAAGATYSETFTLDLEDPDMGGETCFDLADPAIRLVSVNDWFDPRWGGGFNAVFELELTDEMIEGNRVRDWVLDVDYAHPDAQITTGWTNGYNATVDFDPETGAFSTVDQAYQLSLEAGDTIRFAVQVLDAPFDEANVHFCFTDLDPDPVVPTGSNAIGLVVDAAPATFWGAGSVQTVAVENTGGEAVDAWAVKLDLDPGEADQIESLTAWRAQRFSDGEDFYFVPRTYNTHIEAGGMETFGFLSIFKSQQDTRLWADDDLTIVGLDDVPGFDPLTLDIDLV